MNWIPEADAAKMLLRKPRTLRENVKSRKWKIQFTCVDERRYQYNVDDIKKLLNQSSNTFVK